MMRQQSQRVSAATCVSSGAFGENWIAAGVLQEQVGQLIARFVEKCLSFELVLEHQPARKSAFQRQRMLYVAQARVDRSVGICAFETGARFLVVRTQGFEPALCFFLQVFEGA